MKHFTRSAIIGFLLFIGYTALCATADNKHILPNTTVNDIDVSGMTIEEAAVTLKADAEARRNASEFTISFENNNYTVNVRDALILDYEAAAKKAFQEGHSGFFSRGLARIKSHITGNHINNPPITENSEELHHTLEASGLLDAITAAKNTYKIEHEKLLVTAGAARRPDEENLRKELTRAVQTKDYDPMISCPSISDDMANLERIHQEIYTEPQNATLDRNNNYTVTEAVAGIDFDIDNAKKYFLT